ncbi:MAG: potassium channel family protein, partial [Catalinimonas sp.]
MNYLLLLLGFAIIIVTILDIGKTTLSPHGAGWISGRLSLGIWKLFKWLSGNDPRRWGLSYAGSVIIGLLLLTYILLLWTGHTFVFLSDDNAVIHGSTKRHADPWEVVYFVGYNLSTMGNGDFVGGTMFWKIFASFISFTGLVLITISITYLIPIVESQVGKQQLSLRIHTLGRSPIGILKNTWNGKDFAALGPHIEGMIDTILEQSQQHMAYPVLRYFHAPDPQMSDTVALTTLDEAVSILQTY